MAGQSPAIFRFRGCIPSKTTIIPPGSSKLERQTFFQRQSWYRHFCDFGAGMVAPLMPKMIPTISGKVAQTS